MKVWQGWLVLVAGSLAIGGLAAESDHCSEAWVKYGVTVKACPAGNVRQTAALDVFGLRRGGDGGTVMLRATAHYTTRDSSEVQRVDIPSLRVTALALVDAKQAVTPLAIEGRWEGAGPGQRATLKLPAVPDGDYKLRAAFETQVGAGELEVAVPLYTPARIHVITDRPLYEPGNVVRFRAVALSARDLSPLDERPGVWVVTDPNRDVVLEERAPAGAWGVVAGSFPLDKGAPVGEWKIAWRSADASDEVAFTVKPFTLPRFRVDATTDRAYYRAGYTPVIRGAVLYASGAPVPRAAIDVQWAFAGAWPPPREWQERLLPKQVAAGANGRFELALPKIPDDLQGRVSITAQLSAIDPAGDRAVGAATVLLSEDGIVAEPVTELGDGLIQGFNNRLYVRVTTPDGREVASSKVQIRRAWQPTDPGTDALLDEDGVASLQVDPGAPVNVVIPARPYRPAPRPPLVARGEARELIAGEGASLADQVELDRWLAPLAPCARWHGAGGDTDATVGFHVERSGAISQASAGPTALDQCAAAVVRRQRLPAGAERMYAVSFSFTDPQLPSLSLEVDGALDPPEGLDEALDTIALGARACLPAVASGRLPRALTWRARAGSRDVELGPWLDDPEGAAEARGAIACATAQLAGKRIRLAAEAPADSLGLVRIDVVQPASVTEARPQPTTMLGYELVVTATDLPGRPSTKLRLAPGTVPDLRLRVTPVLARAGDTITAQLIRGPSFRSALPKKLEVRHLKGHEEIEVAKDNTITAKIPADAEGWVEVRGGGVRALVYVKPPNDLAVSIAPGRDRYKPGEQAELQLRTLIGGRGGKAAVGLFGVDDSLAQLVALAGPGDLGRVQPKVATSSPAFGLLDGQALMLGRIRGANAAAATVLRVTEIPKPAELDAVVTAHAQSSFDPVVELTDHFYVVLAELHTQARRWEAEAAPAEKMQPATMARLWARALETCEARGELVTDAYGRRLTLSRLPADLLALTDPRAVIVVGTRLPEDVENWAEWVRKERP